MCHYFPYSYQYPDFSCQTRIPKRPSGSSLVVLARHARERFPSLRGFLTGPALAPGMPSYLAGLGHAPKLLILPLLNQGLSLFGPLHRPAHGQHGFQGLSSRPAVNFLLLEESPGRGALQSTPPLSDWPESLESWPPQWTRVQLAPASSH